MLSFNANDRRYGESRVVTKALPPDRLAVDGDLADSLAPAKGLRHASSSSQELLRTLLGDYWFGRDTFIPSAALVELLGTFGMTEQAGRAILSRASRNGTLIGRRESRHTAYRMAPEGVRLTLMTGRNILRFAGQTPDRAPKWDGTWTLVSYALSTEQAEARRRIRRYLRWRGFAPLQDGLWIAPRRRTDHIARLMRAHKVGTFALFEQAHQAAANELDPLSLWPMHEIAERYQALIADFRKVVRRLRRRVPTGADALALRTEAMTAWRPMPRVDPNLPLEMLPAKWPGWTARQLFTEVYDTLGPPAAQHVEAVVGKYSAEAAAAVQFDTVAHPRPAR